MKLVVGLGNPGEEYENTRHNTGWIVLDFMLGKKVDWQGSKHTKLLFYKDSISGKPVEYIKPTTFMNNSGVAVAHVKDKHKLNLKDIVVIYDDMDLPLGKIKISFNRSSGGHNGVNSIIKSLKTEEFTRIRVGVSPTTPSGKIRKPKGEEAVLKFLMGEFKKPELDELKKISKKIAEIVEVIFTEGKEKAMSLYN
ncbi:MAG TPA: aminoacyl-tRNA hydrolase [Candidatus Paceibacterota bacterium]|nr:aminoacyl-tRNA hydrolase [Candidatus Paceibacterota bacterium]